MVETIALNPETIALNDAINANRLIEFLKEQDTTFFKANFFIEIKSDSTTRLEGLSLLTYLIEKHDDLKMNMSEAIRYLIEEGGANLNRGEPLHYLLKRRKLILLTCFLDDALSKQFKKQIKLGVRDKEGFTLIARLIEAKEYEYIALFSKRHLSYSSDITVNGERVPLLPLQQAILTNKSKTIEALINIDADSVSSPCLFADNAFFLAARFAKMDALNILVNKYPDFDLNKPNGSAQCLIDLL